MVCPVHNDAAMLNLTIKSIYGIKPDEVLFALDRCTDKSESIVKKAGRLFPKSETRYFEVEEDDFKDWRFRSAGIRRLLYDIASSEIIVNTSADLNLDPQIRNHVKLIPERYGLVSFGYLDRWNLATFAGRMHQIIRRDGFGGLLAFSQPAWRECEDLEDLKRIAQGEDDHLHRAIEKKYKVCNIVTDSLHLRPNRRSGDYLCGWDTRKRGPISGVNLLYRSVLRLSPAFTMGYIHADRAKRQGQDLDVLAERMIRLKKGRVGNVENMR